MTPSTGNQAAELEIRALVTQCAMGLRGYGKEPEQLPVMIKMFIETLGEFPIIRIKAAFKAYLRTQSEMPTPADIIGLIEGADPEWKFIFTALDSLAIGGRLTESGCNRMVQSLGKNWREYV